MATALDAVARDLLDGANLAVLSTLMPDGSPQSSTVWARRLGSTIVIATTEGTLKLRNIRRDPRVALVVIDRTDPERQLQVRGRVLTASVERGRAAIDLLSAKYYGVSPYPFHDGRAWVEVRIKPERVRATFPPSGDAASAPASP